MATTLDLSTHRTWEDWCTMGLGLLTAVSPAIVQAGDMPGYAILSVVVTGTLVMLCGYLELDSADRWEKWAECALGAWLVATPWAFAYSHLGLITGLHVGYGACIVALAVLELWQDRDRAGRMA